MTNLQNPKRQRKYIVKRFGQLIDVLDMEHRALKELFKKCSPLSLHHALNDFFIQIIFESPQDLVIVKMATLIVMKKAFLNIHSIVMGWDYDPNVQLKYAIQDVFSYDEITLIRLLDDLHKYAGEHECQVSNIHYAVLSDLKTMLLNLHIERNKLVQYQKSAS